jgi:hypothetical protein
MKTFVSIEVELSEFKGKYHDALRLRQQDQARIAQLEAALRELQELGEQGMKPDYREWLTFHDKVALVSRTALETGGVE